MSDQVQFPLRCADPTDGAVDTLLAGAGVRRDFAHLDRPAVGGVEDPHRVAAPDVDGVAEGEPHPRGPARGGDGVVAPAESERTGPPRRRPGRPDRRTPHPARRSMGPAGCPLTAALLFTREVASRQHCGNLENSHYSLQHRHLHELSRLSVRRIGYYRQRARKSTAGCLMPSSSARTCGLASKYSCTWGRICSLDSPSMVAKNSFTGGWVNR